MTADDGGRPRRALGTTGLAVHPLCLGTNVFGWSLDDSASFAVLDAYLDAGGNFLDTADYYSAFVPGKQGGESEEVIGRWLASRRTRDKVIVATKVGKGALRQPPGLSRALVRSGIEASLRRLQTDYVDLYYIHQDDPAVPMEETLAALANLVTEGKVRALGASNLSAERLADAIRLSASHGMPGYQVCQPLYNLLERQEYEAGLSQACERLDVAVVSYFSLARGFLTGKYRPGTALPKSVRAGQASKYLNQAGVAVLDALDHVAAAHGATQAQVALAWLAARPGIVAPIASASSPAQLSELVGFTSLTLSGDEMRLLTSAGLPASRAGAE